MLLIDRLTNTFYHFKHIINSIINDQKYFAFKKVKIKKKKFFQIKNLLKGLMNNQNFLSKFKIVSN